MICLISAINFCESCSLAACAQGSTHFSLFSRIADYLLGLDSFETTRLISTNPAIAVF